MGFVEPDDRGYLLRDLIRLPLDTWSGLNARQRAITHQPPLLKQRCWIVSDFIRDTVNLHDLRAPFCQLLDDLVSVLSAAGDGVPTIPGCDWGQGEGTGTYISVHSPYRIVFLHCNQSWDALLCWVAIQTGWSLKNLNSECGNRYEWQP